MKRTAYTNGCFTRRALTMALALALVLLCSGCGQQAESREPQAIIEEMVVDQWMDACQAYDAQHGAFGGASGC